MTNPLDPENPVNALCIQGMEAEGRGDPEDARALFARAWDRRSNHIEAAIAAHYVARHQDTAPETLLWNQRALDEAMSGDPQSVSGFLPSLHLNLGKSHEDMGDLAAAREQYLLAELASSALGNDGYGRMIRGGIGEALKRTEAGVK
jgi:hypothetical protein